MRGSTNRLKITLTTTRASVINTHHASLVKGTLQLGAFLSFPAEEVSRAEFPSGCDSPGMEATESPARG